MINFKYCPMLGLIDWTFTKPFIPKGLIENIKSSKNIRTFNSKSRKSKYVQKSFNKNRETKNNFKIDE